MTIKELKKHLENYNDELEVKFINYDNGGGLYDEQIDISELHLLLDEKKLILG